MPLVDTGQKPPQYMARGPLEDEDWGLCMSPDPASYIRCIPDSRAILPKHQQKVRALEVESHLSGIGRMLLVTVDYPDYMRHNAVQW